ncbi:MAG: DUF2800 domain-containing protein [Thermoanaerobacteraceae bacterium]|nr:DUF2800 domain-containing protein [Thermoanaerobacteraceae bacterium]
MNENIQIPANETPEHALLSASAAHRWLVCTPSARLEETLPEKKSDYADEGNLAHDIAELKLKKAFIEQMPLRTFNSRLKKLQKHELYQDEMLTHTDTYLDYVSGIVYSFTSPPYIAVEKKLDFSAYVPEGFGTGDCIIISGTTLYIIDFKYGKGVPVSAEDNPQMKLYALGAYEAYKILYPINTVKMVIVQPRLDVISEWEMQLVDLLAWGESIRLIAQTAYEGKGHFVSGEHCRFCRAKALCRARADFNISLEDSKGKMPPLISNAEVGDLLKRARDLVAWIKDLEEYALAECLAGNEVPGWKAVHGRANREFTDQDAAFKLLIENGIDEAVLYERKPITLTSVEKLLGKKEFQTLLGNFVVKPPGKPTLVLESDKREPIKRQSAAEDFAGAINVPEKFKNAEHPVFETLYEQKLMREAEKLPDDV